MTDFPAAAWRPAAEMAPIRRHPDRYSLGCTNSPIDAIAVAMVGRASGAPVAAVGRREDRRSGPGGESRADTRALETPEQPLARANEEITSLRAEIELLKHSNSESSARLWAKIGAERARAKTAAVAAQAKAIKALERATRETAAHEEAASTLAARLEAARARAG
ncbi:MAG TPA: hypothetical protein VIJ94_15005, partial [Caulobacteraceae bacterium]